MAASVARCSDDLPPAWFAVFDEVELAPPLAREPDAVARYRLGPWRADCDADSNSDSIAGRKASIFSKCIPQLSAGSVHASKQH